MVEGKEVVDGSVNYVDRFLCSSHERWIRGLVRLHIKDVPKCMNGDRYLTCCLIPPMVSYERILSQFEQSSFVFMMGEVFFFVGVALAPLLFAPLSERVGRKPVLLFATLSTLLFYLGQTLARHLLPIVISRAIQGFVGGCILPIGVGEYRQEQNFMWSQVREQSIVF